VPRVAPGAGLAAALPAAPTPHARITVRVVDDASERLLVRRSIVHPVELARDRGAMVTAWRRGGVGYCATADLSRDGLRAAAEVADGWAARVERHGVFDGLDLRTLLDPTPLAAAPDALGEPLPLLEQPARASPPATSSAMPARAILLRFNLSSCARVNRPRRAVRTQGRE